MDYVIINGKDSRDVNGLFVASLAPITKPAIRVETLSIDGRDGDISTPLGYDAYDKKIIIGTFPDADIDEIIDFFSGSGEVVFSNEPEKCYDFEILSQIDYEQVIRMRRAEVTFHVQPYKYPSKDRKRLFSAPVSPLQVSNYGNAVSSPVYTIEGKGTITFSLNGVAVLAVAFGSNFQKIRIDTNALEATLPDGAYANRSITGEYHAFRLNQGKNEIAWSGGQVASIEIERFTRWI